MHQIRVLLAEDHMIVRKGLRALLKDADDIEVIAEAEDGREAITKTRELRPDVVVMDISMPRLNGIEAIRRIKHTQPEVKIVILTMHDDEEYIFQCLQSGAESYLIKNSAPNELVTAIQVTHRGESFLSPAISKKVVEEAISHSNQHDNHSSYDRLTSREREVLQLIAEGHTVREIAKILIISEKTVRTHRSHIMKKLDLNGTAALTLYALRKGIISLEE